MRLDEYLEALQNCPDEELKDEFGLYDNFPILLNANFDYVVEHLRQSENYQHEGAIDKTSRRTHLFRYAPGSVKLQVSSEVTAYSTTGNGFNGTERDRTESERQLRDYDMAIILHPCQDRKIEGVHWLRALAIVADEIGQFAIKEGIPTCMPEVGWKYHDEMDYSQIVYHEPKTAPIS